MTVYTNLSKAITDANAGNANLVEMEDGTYDISSRAALTHSSVIFKAKNTGKAILKGAPIDLKGTGMEFSGFDLQYSTSGDYIHIERTCKLLNNKIHFANSAKGKWIIVNDPDVSIIGNEIYNKTTMDTFITVNSPGAKIQNNYFHDLIGSGTPMEAIRLGASSLRAVDFHSDVSGNTFERISADTELITVKSSNNDLHDNTFRNCNSSPTFRHGRFNKFRNNKCLGSGLRIYGKGHEVSGNQFIRNPNSQLLQVVIGNGEYAEEEQNTTAGYTQVRDLVFKNNYIIGEDSTTNILLCMGYGSHNLKPINNQFLDNIITGARGTLANTHDGASWTGNTLSNNIQWVTGSALYGNMPGIHKDPKLVKNADGTYSLPTVTPTTTIYDDFKYTYDFTETSKSPNGKWQAVYLGYGYARADGSGLLIQPKAGALAAALIKSTQTWGNYLAEWDITNQAQVVSNPQQWMCPWAFIRYLDERRHYYVYCGLTHMEFGKKDAPATATDVEAYQKTIWTGGPATTIGQKRHIGFQAVNDTFTIWVDGTKVMEKTDVSSFKTGSYCIYTEGARGYYQNVSITPK